MPAGLPSRFRTQSGWDARNARRHGDDCSFRVDPDGPAPSSKVRFECVGTTDSMMWRNVRFPSAGLVGSNVSVSSVAIGVADELCSERIAASQDAVAECSVTEVIGRI